MIKMIGLAMMVVLGIQQIVIIAKLENIENLLLEGDLEEEETKE